MNKIFIISMLSILFSCTTINKNISMENNEKDYEEIMLKVPKGYGIKERYLIKDKDKVFSYENKKGNAGIYIDKDTKKPANGLLKDYYKNGALKYEAILVDGQIVGKAYLYHENGNLAEFKQFIKGHIVPDGIFVYYSPSGKINEVIFYGETIGDSRIFKKTILQYNKKGEVTYNDY